MAGPAPCAAYSGQKWRYELLYDPVAGWEVVSPKKMIGFSMNRDDADSADADEHAGNIYADYRWWSIGPMMFSLGRPMVWESGSLPSNSNTHGDPWAYQVWRFYGVAGAKGDSVFNASSWQSYMSQLSWDVLDNWMGRQPQRLWLVFRNAEWPTYNYTADRGASGYLGVWGNWLDLLDTDTYEQACNRNLYTDSSYQNCGVESDAREHHLPGTLRLAAARASRDAETHRPGWRGYAQPDLQPPVSGAQQYGT